MKKLFSYKCPECGHEQENLRHLNDNVICDECSSITSKLITTPAFTFTNGKGTDGGQTMRIPGNKELR
jgi:putative FmdB family regulatory protein